MGLWGAAQAIAAGFGGLLGTILVDLLQILQLSTLNAYGTVFLFEASLFVWAAVLASTSILKPQNNQPMPILSGELTNV